VFRVTNTLQTSSRLNLWSPDRGTFPLYRVTDPGAGAKMQLSRSAKAQATDRRPKQAHSKKSCDTVKGNVEKREAKTIQRTGLGKASCGEVCAMCVAAWDRFRELQEARSVQTAREEPDVNLAFADCNHANRALAEVRGLSVLWDRRR